MTLAKIERRFRISDAMILVAAIAIGLAWHREGTPEALTFRKTASSPLFFRLSNEIRELMICLTLGWAILRLRRPRPHLRRMLRSPGSAIGFAALIGLGMGLIEWIGLAIFRYMPRDMYWNFFITSSRLTTTMTAPAGPMALGTLVALLVTGVQRPRRGALEWIGVAIGVGFIIPLISSWLQPWLAHMAPTFW